MSDLPVEWLEIEWEELTNSKDGFKRGPFGGSLKKEIFVESGYAIYEQYQPINDDCSNFRYFIDEEKFNELKGFEVKAGDFLISCSGTMGRITRVPEQSPQGVINQALLRIRLNEELIISSFFLKLFRSSFIQEKILNSSVGGAIQNLASVKDLKQIKFPLPPLAEQEKIAELLDSYLAQVETIKAQLSAIPDILKKFRQSVLADAVSGRLTEEWRNGKKNWEELMLKDVGTWGSGGTPSRTNPEYFNGDIPWVKTGDLKEKYLTFVDEYITPLALQNSSAKIFPKNSVIIAMYGATIGKVSILTMDSATNQACGVLQIDTSIANVDFLYYFLLSQKENFIKQAKGGAQPNISQTVLKSYPINLPPIEEQQQIVERVEKLFAYADDIETQTTQALDHINNLTQSILAKAFSGQLTAEWRTQNPALITGDNSATALLAQIRASKQTEKKPPKPKTKKKGDVC